MIKNCMVAGNSSHTIFFLLENKSYTNRISAYGCKLISVGAIQRVWVQPHFLHFDRSISIIQINNPKNYLPINPVIKAWIAATKGKRLVQLSKIPNAVVKIRTPTKIGPTPHWLIFCSLKQDSPHLHFEKCYKVFSHRMASQCLSV